MKYILAVVALGSALSAFAGEARWPMFRGPNAAGVAESSKVPDFGPGTNQLYKVKVPEGLSSPCIWDKWIFLTAFENKELVTLCLNREDGKLLWRQSAPYEKLELYMARESSPASATPCTDGKRVYVYFGSSGLIAYDCATGSEQWTIRMPVAQQIGDFGSGTSPIVQDGIVILNRDMMSGSFIAGYDAVTGKELWRKERPEFLSSYSTPIIWKHDGGTEIVTVGFVKMKAYDLKTGGEKWERRGFPGAVCTTPVVGNDMLYFAGWSPGENDFPLPTFSELLEKNDANKDGGLQRDETQPPINMLYAFLDADKDGRMMKEEFESQMKKLTQGENSLVALKAPQKGQAPELAWKHTRNLPYVPSPVLYQGVYYMVRDGGMISAFNAKSGEPFYQQERLGVQGSYYPSLVAGDGKIIVMNNEGKITILKAGETLEIIGKADLQERATTTPALVDNKVYIRSAEHLWAFGQK